jgi:hypothetical protein
LRSSWQASKLAVSAKSARGAAFDHAELVDPPLFSCVPRYCTFVRANNTSKNQRFQK